MMFFFLKLNFKSLFPSMRAASSLEDIHDRIKADKENLAAAQQKLRAEAQKGSDFNVIVKTIFVSGSYARSTAIQSSKDVDLIVILKDEKIAGENILGNLQRAFSNVGVRKTKQDTSLGCTLDGIDFDLVGAVETGVVPALECPLWRVFKRSTKAWVFTNPMWHKMRTQELDVQWDGKFRKLVRLAKAWNVKNNEKMFRSFHLELLVRDFLERNGHHKVSRLPEMVEPMFRHVRTYRETVCRDPAPGCDSQLPKELTRIERDKLIKNIESAIESAQQNRWEQMFLP